MAQILKNSPTDQKYAKVLGCLNTFGYKVYSSQWIEIYAKENHILLINQNKALFLKLYDIIVLILQ